MILEKMLSPGMEVLVQAPVFISPRFIACLRGYEPGKYIMLDNQTKDGGSRPLEPGMHCVIRLLHKAQIIGFKAEVLNRTGLPAPLVFLRYPKEVETLAVLKGKARQVLMDTVLSPHKLHGRLDGHRPALILNLTENGCLVESEEALELNSLGYLTCMLPEIGPIRDFPVEVKTCRNLAGRSRAVLNFLEADPAQRQKFAAYLKQLDDLDLKTAYHRTSSLEGIARFPEPEGEGQG